MWAIWTGHCQILVTWLNELALWSPRSSQNLTWPRVIGSWDLRRRAVRQATAFITWMGIFVWNRIPMGLQPAASYFQYCMLMIVLAGLAYVICEGYIDDIIVHGQDDTDLLVNLRQVFERCRQYRIAFNPKKSVQPQENRMLIVYISPRSNSVKWQNFRRM